MEFQRSWKIGLVSATGAGREARFAGSRGAQAHLRTAAPVPEAQRTLGRVEGQLVADPRPKTAALDVID